MNQTQRIIDAFTDMAPRYEETVDRELRQFWGIGYSEFIELVLARLDLRQSQAVLDVATGRGAIPLALAGRSEWDGHAVGVDITPPMLKGADERVIRAGERGRVSLACASGMRLPFAGGAFDAAICALATHHMQLRSLLTELHRVLRPGGQLLLADVALLSFWHTPVGHLVLGGLARWYTWRETKTRSTAEIEAIANMRTPEQWRHEVIAAGFGIREAVTITARRRWYPPGILVAATADSTRSTS